MLVPGTYHTTKTFREVLALPCSPGQRLTSLLVRRQHLVLRSHEVHSCPYGRRRRSPLQRCPVCRHDVCRDWSCWCVGVCTLENTPAPRSETNVNGMLFQMSGRQYFGESMLCRPLLHVLNHSSIVTKSTVAVIRVQGIQGQGCSPLPGTQQYLLRGRKMRRTYCSLSLFTS